MKVLVFIAHPDDETILTGGALALLSRAGVEVDYLCATRGEGGEVGEPPLCTREELGEVREEEMKCAVAKLGGKRITFFDYTDPEIGEDGNLLVYTDDLVTLTKKVASFILQTRPHVLITHGSNGEYGHPAHVLTNQAAMLVVSSLSENAPLVYTFSANFSTHPRPRLANSNDQAHFVLDISSVMDQKIGAAYCHKTQNALFVRRSSKRAGRKLSIPEVLMRVEGLHLAYPKAFKFPEDPLSNLLLPWIMPIVE